MNFSSSWDSLNREGEFLRDRFGDSFDEYDRIGGIVWYTVRLFLTVLNTLNILKK